MKVFDLDADTPGFKDLADAVDHARKIGRGVRIGVDGNALKVAIGQMMWSLPIAEIPEPALAEQEWQANGNVYFNNQWWQAYRSPSGEVYRRQLGKWIATASGDASTFQPFKR